MTHPTNSTFEIILEIFEEDEETEVNVNAKIQHLLMEFGMSNIDDEY